MKKTILYIATAATLAAVSVIAIIGCNDGGANAGRVSEEVNAFLNKFDNAVPAVTVTPPDTSSGSITYKLITNVSTPEGGTVSRNPDKEAYAFGEAVTVTATPAGGYTFIEWSGESKSTNTTVVVTMDGDKALTADFGRKGATRFTVTFNRNNSYGTDQPPAAEADSGAAITLPAMANIYSPSSNVKPVEHTYIFIGWNTNPNASGTEYSAGSSYTVTGNVILYAQWKTESTTRTCGYVYYNGNGNTGGSVPGVPEVVCGGCDMSVKTLVIGQDMLVKTGYDFGGWSEDADGLGTVYQPGQQSSYTGCGTLYAVWIPRKYTLTVVASPSNGGSVSVNPSKANYGHGEQVMVTARAATGYKFTEWSGASSSKDNPITIIMDDNKTLTGGFGKPDAKKFTVTFNSNGGGNNPQAATADSGSNITFPDQGTMQKTGYSFNGWNTKTDGMGTAYLANSSYTVTQDITLFAVWTATTHNITYTLNGATTTPSNPASYTIETASFILNNPSRTCYTFSGWTGSNGTTPQTSVTVAQGGTGEKSYVANWMALSLSYTLTTNVSPAGGGTVSRNPNQTTPYSCGTSVTVTAVAASGYVFTGWSGAATSSSASVSVTVNSEMTLTANFEEIFGTFTDSRNSKTYKTVRIGNQRWMAENLNYAVDSSWCNGNNSANCDKYGRLYQWSAAMQGASSSNTNPSGVRGVCPSGWHLPSSAEWDALMTAVGGSSTAGKKLKSQSGWNSYTSSGVTYSGNGTDEYGFSALPGGYRRSDGSFYGAGNYGDWWTATENSAYDAYNRDMYYDNDNVSSNNFNKSYAWSVRCVGD